MAGNEPTVKDHMHAPIITISAEAGLDRALLIMRKQHLRHLPVVEDGGKMVGMISDRDLRLSMQEMEQGPGGAPLRRVLSMDVSDRTVARVPTQGASVVIHS